ncbi:hypothetical protein [Polyangium jinanense]|uniref:Uncharacterized protein n=1 Tax=Polyangium jinanense TaxID=2829994 RepID=A0A9X3XHV7_9BACT|nr:hypothetical protein [Polyangium jinanense]MDC3962663.1 hypothetical protein [Polyangium jinanense]MDC3989383.1 hypothetical protein [Polyangium jinanense]
MAALWGVPGAYPRTTLLEVLVQNEITAAAAGDVEIVALSHVAAGKLLTMLPVGDPSIDAARPLLLYRNRLPPGHRHGGGWRPPGMYR